MVAVVVAPTGLEKLPDIDIPSHLPLHDCCFTRAAEAADAKVPVRGA